MKKTIGKLASLMLALIMVIGVLANPAFAVNEKTFDDVAEGEWYYGYVMMLAEDDIVGGFGGTNEFRPDSKLTREQAAKMIALAAKFEHEDLQSEFEDVDPNGWATGYIAALETREVVKGWGTTGEFRPTNNIQRGHAAKMVGKAFDLKEGSLERTLTDLPADAEVEEAIKVLASNGIVKGYGDTEEFRPAEEISRAEFSKILCIAMVASAMQEAEADPTAENVAEAQALFERLPKGEVLNDEEALNYLQDRVDALELTVTDVSAIDATTIEVTFDNEEVVEIELEEALVHGENEVTFTYEDQEFTVTVEYVDPAVVELEAAIEAAEAAIAALPSVEEVAIEDAEAVADAKALVEAVKALDAEAVVEGEEVIAELEAKIAELIAEEEAAQAKAEAIEAVEGLIEAIPALEELTLEDAEAVAEARAAFEAAKEEHGVVATEVENIADLVNAENKIAELEAEAALAAALLAYGEALAAVEEEDYTEASWAAYQVVVAANVVDAEENTVEEINAATSAILEAQEDLVTHLEAAEEALEDAILAARDAVEKAEDSLLNVDIENAQELVDVLESLEFDNDNLSLIEIATLRTQAMQEAAALQIRLEGLEPRDADIVAKVNNARTQAQLITALSDDAFDDFNDDYIVEYEDKLEDYGSRVYETIDQIQAVINIVNVEQKINELPDEITLADKAAVESAKEAYDALPSDNENNNGVDEKYRVQLAAAEARIVALELAEYKAAKIVKLENHVDADFYTENREALDTAIENGITNINGSSTIAWVDIHFAAAKAAIDEIDTDLELATAAVELVENVPQAGDSRITEAQRLINILPEGEEKQDLQERLDLVIADRALRVAKADALAELDAYVDKTEYVENAEALEEALEAGEEAINASETVEAVETALGNAIEAIDAIESDADIALAEATAAVVAAEEAPLATKGNRVDKQDLVEVAEGLVEELVENRYEDGVVADLVERLEDVQAELDSTVFTEDELKAALANEDIETIKLYDDIVETEGLKLNGKNVAFDLNGKTLNTAKLEVKNSTVVFRDSSENGEGTLATNGKAGVINAENSNVTIENGRFVNNYNSSDGRAYVIQLRNSELTINGGYFENSDSVGGYNYLIKTNSWSTTEKTTITINDGEFVSHRNYGYFVTGDSTANVEVVINGGKFESTGNYSYLANVKGSVVINGGKFDTTGVFAYLTNVNGSVVVNDFTYTATNNNQVFFMNNEDSSVTVKGGTFSVKTDSEAGLIKHNKDNGTTTIKGTLLVDPVNPVKVNQLTHSRFWAEGATQSAKDADGFYTISK